MPVKKVIDGNYYVWKEWIYLAYKTEEKGSTGSKCYIDTSKEHKTYYSNGTSVSGDMRLSELRDATLHEIAHLNACINADEYVDPPTKEVEGKYYQYLGDVEDGIEAFIYKHASSDNHPFTGFHYGISESQGYHKRTDGRPNTYWSGDMDPYKIVPATEAQIKHLKRCISKGVWVPPAELRQRVPQKELRKGQRYFVKSEDGDEWVITWDADGYVYFGTEPEYVHESFRHYPLTFVHNAGYEYFNINAKDSQNFTDLRDKWYVKNLKIGQVYMYPCLDREYIVTYEGVSEGGITLGPFIHKHPGNQYYQESSLQFTPPKEFQKARLATDAEKEHLAQCEKAGKYVDYEAEVSWDIDNKKWKERSTIKPGVGLMNQINIHGGGRHAGKMHYATQERLYKGLMEKWAGGPITTKDRHSDAVTAFGMAMMAGRDGIHERPLTPDECFKPKLKCYVKSEVKPVEQPKRIKLALPTRPNPLVLNIQPEKTTPKKSERVVLNVRTFKTNH